MLAAEVSQGGVQGTAIKGLADALIALELQLDLDVADGPAAALARQFIGAL
jgi:hypothetical protein|tara:strand:+ start:15020 stop:15172 length:153 start_codon:yes stop_codon:yes gene_type:complete